MEYRLTHILAKQIKKLKLVCFPINHIDNYLWKEEWIVKERISAIKSISMALKLISIIYILHFFLVDLILNLTPIIFWFSYRFGLAILLILVIVITKNIHVSQSKWYKEPVLFAGILCCAMQAESLNWYEKIPIFYNFILPPLAIIILKDNVFIGLVRLIGVVA